MSYPGPSSLFWEDPEHIIWLIENGHDRVFEDSSLWAFLCKWLHQLDWSLLRRATAAIFKSERAMDCLVHMDAQERNRFVIFFVLPTAFPENFGQATARLPFYEAAATRDQKRRTILVRDEMAPCLARLFKEHSLEMEALVAGTLEFSSGKNWKQGPIDRIVSCISLLILRGFGKVTLCGSVGLRIPHVRPEHEEVYVFLTWLTASPNAKSVVETLIDLFRSLGREVARKRWGKLFRPVEMIREMIYEQYHLPFDAKQIDFMRKDLMQMRSAFYACVNDQYVDLVLALLQWGLPIYVVEDILVEHCYLATMIGGLQTPKQRIKVIGRICRAVQQARTKKTSAHSSTGAKLQRVSGDSK